MTDLREVAGKVMMPFKSDEERARAEIGRLNSAREQLHQKIETARAGLVTLRANLPDRELDRLLEGHDSDVDREDIRRLETASEGGNAALTALIPRLRKWHDALRGAKADVLMRQADEIAKKREALEKRVNAKLHELSEIAEAEFIPLATANREVFMALLTNKDTIPPQMFPARTPKPELLRAEENALIERAKAIMMTPIRDRGEVTGLSVDEVLKNLAEDLASGLVIGPTAGEVRAFFTPAMTQAALVEWRKPAYRRGQNTPAEEAIIPNPGAGGGSVDAPYVTRFHLVWINGVINTAASRVACEPPAQRVTLSEAEFLPTATGRLAPAR